MSPIIPIRVMLVDDHEMVRSGLAFFLSAFDDLELVGQAASGEEALRYVGEGRAKGKVVIVVEQNSKT